MAELLWKQGHRDEALRVYRSVVMQYPEDATARARLAELLGPTAGAQGETMSFRDHIQQIVDAVPGAMACTVMGFDGIAIDSHEREGGSVDLPTLLTEYAGAAIQLKRGAAQQPETGSVDEVMVAGSHMIAILRLLTEEYFLAVVLRPTALVGKARYLMRMHAPALIQELS
ncbi:MAG: tetratricopeptide repeat protein [Myxococcota bacterium]